MKKKTVTGILAVILGACTLLSCLCSCDAPAPAGMYAPVDAEEYVEGVEDVIFSVPEEYRVTMSSNMLAAVGKEDTFSLQCRHSDYYYRDLEKNYVELKKELVGLYGQYEEVLEKDCTVAEQNALCARYSLKISGIEVKYVQYLFYKGKQFYLFTYSTKGETNESLLEEVLQTVAFGKENYKVPEGFRAVRNAEADQINSDRYELYCPDEWILDTSLGQISMRVPSSKVISGVVFNEIDLGEKPQDYIDRYKEKVASDFLFGTEVTGLEEYICATVAQFSTELKDFKLRNVSPDGSEQIVEIEKSTILSRREEYLKAYTNEDQLIFSYIEYTAKLSDFDSHGSGSLFHDPSNDETEDSTKAEPIYEDYRVRQYFLLNGRYLYLFTCVSAEETFQNQEDDMVRVVKNFVLKEPA